MSLLILMGQPPRNPERFGMGDFNFAPSVVKMQRSARISRLARVYPSRQSEHETTHPPDFALKCGSNPQGCFGGLYSRCKRKEVQQRCGNRTSREVLLCPLAQSRGVPPCPRPQATNQPPPARPAPPPHRRQPPIRPRLARAWEPRAKTPC